MLPSAEVTTIAYAYVWAYIWTTAADVLDSGTECLLLLLRYRIVGM